MRLGNVRSLATALLCAGIVSTQVACNDDITATDFKVAPLKQGGDVSLSDFKGKPVMLYFWATWCGPCREFAPVLDALHDEFAPKGVVFMAIAEDDRAKVRAYELEHPHHAPVYFDDNGAAMAGYNANGLPNLFVISPSGQIVYHAAGVNQMTGPDLAKLFDEQLKKATK